MIESAGCLLTAGEWPSTGSAENEFAANSFDCLGMVGDRLPIRFRGVELLFGRGIVSCSLLRSIAAWLLALSIRSLEAEFLLGMRASSLEDSLFGIADLRLSSSFCTGTIDSASPKGFEVLLEIGLVLRGRLSYADFTSVSLMRSSVLA